MLFDQAVRLCRAHAERKFPKTGGMCGRVFANLPEYLRGTRYVGEPISYDAMADDWKPKDPIGTFAIALCHCGTSMSLDTKGMSLVTLWRLMALARREARRSDGTVSAFLARLRAEIEKQALEGEALSNDALSNARLEASRRGLVKNVIAEIAGPAARRPTPEMDPGRGHSGSPPLGGPRRPRR